MNNIPQFQRVVDDLKNRWINLRQQPLVRVISVILKLYSNYRSVRHIGNLLVYAQDHWLPHLLDTLPDLGWRAYELIYPLIELALKLFH